MRVARALSLSLRSGVICGLLACWVSLALAEETTGILLDASGSMKGFFVEKTIYELYRKIDGAIEGEKRAYYFKHRSVEEPIESGLEPYSEAVPTRAAWRYGRITLIDRGYEAMLRRHPDLGALWLVTDNIQDPQGNSTEQGDINQFYDKLKQARVQRVYIFPTAMAFDGPIYGRDGQTLVGPYRGPRGVIIYALLFDTRQEAAFTESLRRFGARLGEAGILAKPLDGVTLDGTMKVVEQEVVAEISGGFPPSSRLVLGAPGQGEKTLTSAQPFAKGERLVGEFLVRFRSRLDNVAISGKAEVTAQLKEPFRLVTVPVATPEVHLEPRALGRDLRPGERSDSIAVRLLFPQHVTPTHMEECGWKSQPESYTGRLAVGLKVKKNQLILAKPLLDKYSTRDDRYFTSPEPQYQTRIFRLEELFREASQEENETGQEVYQVAFQVACPVPKPVWWFLGSLAAVVGIVWGGWWLLGRSPNYRLEPLGGGEYHFWLQQSGARRAALRDEYAVEGYYEDGESTSKGYPLRLPLLSVFGRGYSISVNGSRAARIKRRFPAGIYVHREPGFSIDGYSRQALSPTPTGTHFSILPSDDSASSELSFEPPATRRPETKRTDRRPDDDDYPDY